MIIRCCWWTTRSWCGSACAPCSRRPATSRSSARRATARTAWRAARELRPDVVLMDIRMPVMDGLTATKQILALPDPPQVAVLTTFHVDEYVYAALAAGAAGFLLKDTPPREIAAAVRAVADGTATLSPEVTADADRVLRGQGRGARARPQALRRIARAVRPRARGAAAARHRRRPTPSSRRGCSSARRR